MTYTVTKVELDGSREEVIRFWQENFPRWPRAKYEWFYEKNAFGKAACWMLSREGRVVGSAAVFPRDFVFRGRRLRGGITGDFGVDRRNRVLGPALQLQRAVVDGSGWDLLYGYPNRPAEPIQLRAGFTRVGESVRLVRVLRVDAYVKRRVRFEPLVRLISALGNMIIRIKYPTAKFDGSVYRIELPMRFDQRFDKLWQRVATASTRLLGVRNREFLNRRFVQCPYIDYHIFALVRRADNSVAGYVVYRIERGEVHVSDFLAESSSGESGAVLAAFVGYIRQAGFHAISVQYFGDPGVAEEFVRLGFVKRPTRKNLVVCVDDQIDPAGDLRDPTRWYAFEADND